MEVGRKMIYTIIYIGLSHGNTYLKQHSHSYSIVHLFVTTFEHAAYYSPGGWHHLMARPKQTFN